MNPQMSFAQKLIIPLILIIIFTTAFLVFKKNPEIMNTASFYSVLTENSEDNDIVVRSSLFADSVKDFSGLTPGETSSSSALTQKGARSQKMNHDFIESEDHHKSFLQDEASEWQFAKNFLISHSQHSLKVFDENGDLKWSFSPPSPLTLVNGALPLYNKEMTTLVATTNQGSIYAFELASGRVVWHIRAENQYFLAPVLYAEKLLFFAEEPGGQKWSIIPLDLKTLEMKESEGSYELPMAGQPLITGDTLIFATQTGHLLAIDLNTEKTKWTAEGSSGFRNTPTEMADRIYVGNEDGLLVVFDKKNGKKVAEIELGGTIETPVHLKEGAGYGAGVDNGGNLLAFEIKNGGKHVWRYNLGSSQKQAHIELLQLTYHSLSKMNFQSDVRGWTIWAPCQSSHICIFDLKKGGVLHRIDLKGTVASRFAVQPDALWVDEKDKDGIWLKKFVERPKTNSDSGASAGEKKP
jgi:outer membrane protein assembly factor BamB